MPHVVVTRSARQILLELRTACDLFDEQTAQLPKGEMVPATGPGTIHSRLEQTRALILALAHRLVREAVTGAGYTCSPPEKKTPK